MEMEKEVCQPALGFLSLRRLHGSLKVLGCSGALFHRGSLSVQMLSKNSRMT